MTRQRYILPNQIYIPTQNEQEYIELNLNQRVIRSLTFRKRRNDGRLTNLFKIIYTQVLPGEEVLEEDGRVYRVELGVLYLRFHEILLLDTPSHEFRALYNNRTYKNRILESISRNIFGNNPVNGYFPSHITEWVEQNCQLPPQ